MITDPGARTKRVLRECRFTLAAVSLALALSVPGFLPISARAHQERSGVSKAAADSFGAKLKRLESYDAGARPARNQTTHFSEAEWNSYLALVLSANYHPCLRDMRLKFDEGRVRAEATIDFNKLNFNSTQMLNNLVRTMLTGVHSLAVAGSLNSGGGKASFQLAEARFDSLTLPNMLVAEILSAVGRKQQPPFDPTQPNDLPYHIQRVEVRTGSVVVYQ